MDKNIFTIDSDCSGMTVKEYILGYLGYSVGVLKKLKYSGKITVNGKEVFVNHLLSCGEILQLTYPEENSDSIEPVYYPLDILYEDENYLAVNKPSAMPVHPSLYHVSDTLANAVMYYYRDRSFTYRVLTRLDADTTGVVIIAKNMCAASKFPSSGVEKKYLAICCGVPEANEEIIDAPIGRIGDSIIKREVRSDGKNSITEYRLIKENNGISLIRAVPVTGRTHQIRVHLSYIGCPLYADYLYGTEIAGERPRLHCESVVFTDPFTQIKKEITAPLPEDFFIR